MGVYRLLLAFLVLYGHLDLRLYYASYYHTGVAAVISFLILSGFVMTKLVGKYYSRVDMAPRFYGDRLFRIMPQFVFYFLATVFAGEVFGLRHQWMTHVPGLVSSLLQLAVLPMNFGKLFRGDFVVPAAWSLGLEGFFYLVFPFVLIFNVRKELAVASFIIFLAAYARLISTDQWMYRFLPGTFFIFMCGSWLASADTKFEKSAPFVFAGACFVLFCGVYLHPALDVPCSKSVLLGVAVGVPIVAMLRKVNFGSLSWLDDLAGNLSYGIFLNHILVASALTQFGLNTPYPIYFTFEVFLVSILLSYLTFQFIERPFLATRRGFRSAANNNTKSGAPAALDQFQPLDEANGPDVYNAR